jgi:hypothetical protein
MVQSKEARNRKRRAAYAAKKERERVAAEKRERRNARRRELYAIKNAEQIARRREKVARDARQSAIVGDVPTIVVSVFAVKGRHVTSMEPARSRVDKAVKKALGRGVTMTPKTLWATNFDFTEPLTHGALARRLSKLTELEIDLDGGRVHIGAISSDGQYLPLSYAFDTMPETAAMSVDEVLKHLLWYGKTAPTRVEEEDDAKWA